MHVELVSSTAFWAHYLKNCKAFVDDTWWFIKKIVHYMHKLLDLDQIYLVQPPFNRRDVSARESCETRLHDQTHTKTSTNRLMTLRPISVLVNHRRR